MSTGEATETVAFKERKWKDTLKVWTQAGCPDDNPDAPRPGDHPVEDHPWNLDADAYLEKEGI